MPKTRQVAAALQSRAQDRFRTSGLSDLIPEALHPERHAPMARSGQGGKTAEHRRMKAPAGGCYTTDGKARCIELVIGAQDQCSLNQLRLTRTQTPGLRALLVQGCRTREGTQYSAGEYSHEIPVGLGATTRDLLPGV